MRIYQIGTYDYEGAFWHDCYFKLEDAKEAIRVSAMSENLDKHRDNSDPDFNNKWNDEWFYSKTVFGGLTAYKNCESTMIITERLIK